MEENIRITSGRDPLPFQDFNGKRYHLYAGERYYSRGTNRLHRVVWEYIHGPIPEGYEVHHIDSNPANNDPANLECIPASVHTEKHHDKASERARSDKQLQLLDRIREKTKEWHGSEAGRLWHKAHAIECWKNVPVREKACECCGTTFQYRSAHIPRFCSNNCKSKWRRDAGLDNVTRICPVCGRPFTCNRYAKTRTCSGSCANKYRNATRRDG